VSPDNFCGLRELSRERLIPIAEADSAHGRMRVRAWTSGPKKPTGDAKGLRTVASPRVINIEDLRRLARRRLPQVVFDYVDGGAEGEVTFGKIARVFDDIVFRPRQAVAISNCELSTRVLGLNLSFPAILAPVGYSRLMHPAGELAAAAAAGSAGIIYTLSTISGHKLEMSEQHLRDQFGISSIW